MAYVIGAECIDQRDRSCVDVCPVDCIYEGDRKLYISPGECIECGACEPQCPNTAIFLDRVAADETERRFASDNADFFLSVLQGRAAPLGSPGGAAGLGRVGVDTAFVGQFEV